MEQSDIIAENIRIIRIIKGWSQEQLALSAGITPSYIGQIERREKTPTIGIIEKICNALDISMVDLLSIHDAKGDSPRIKNTSKQSLEEIRQVMLEVLRDNKLINCSSQAIHTEIQPKTKGES
ncbi:hypothetical protein PAESOLCIP111_04845 [Paenibacillus solanacearum]|uniref:HTH cro/C1-type domain-containing protein n=1 Tax=Paenibacillus solanacearum TaxID=2048548 RepID=A0A916K6N1_9BACL|nr:helix-turn-helix transcriptional regulator [Paenibacillus solanacearum]CAG7644918.1 hypothetical protein PAESOLCIP111_04845 [Paenibacillus solanacearum]